MPRFVISFSPTPEQSQIVDTIRSFARAVLRPAARDADEAEALPEAVLAQAWNLGFVAAQIPEAYGGGGEPRSPITSALVLEALAHGDPALALAVAHTAAFAFALLEHGSEAHKRALLPSLCGTQFHAAAIALMEPQPLFELHTLGTQARERDSGYAISGTKVCVPLADRASHFLVFARVPSGKLAAFIVARDAPGLSIIAEKNLGLRALPTARLTLNDVVVSRGDRLGDDAHFDANRFLAGSHAASAALLLGLANAVMDYVVPYAKERRAFGQFIAQKQAIAFMLSNMRIETDALRWLTWKAASQLEQGAPALRAARAARTYAVEQCMRIADDGLQVLGGHGYIREHPLELWYRAARTLSVLHGVACL